MAIEKYKIVIVGAGLSGLVLANELLQKGLDKEEIVVLERENRIGGLIRTTLEKGYLSEWGPEGLRGKSDNTKHLQSLLDEPKIPSTEESDTRYLINDGKLTKVPSGLWSAIRTPLMSLGSKLRLFKEPWVKPVNEDENVANFFKRRLGEGIFPIIDAFVAGVYGGDPNQLSISYAFPRLKEFEREHGSIIKGGLNYFRNRKKEKSDQNKKKEKSPFLFTTKTGMEGLLQKLSENCNVRLNQKVQVVEKTEEGYLLITNDGDYICEKLVFATGPNPLTNIQIIDEETPLPVKEAIVTVVSLGFDENAFDKEIRGYGFLTPSKEETFLLGTLFTSRLFPHHAPDGKILLRCFIGGIRHPEYNQLSDEKILEFILDELSRLLSLRGKPEYSKILRHPRGIPQLMINHNELINWREYMVENYTNLFFCGVGWTSIACDGLIEEARETACLITQDQTEVQSLVH